MLIGTLVPCVNQRASKGISSKAFVRYLACRGLCSPTRFILQKPWGLYIVSFADIKSFYGRGIAFRMYVCAHVLFLHAHEQNVGKRKKENLKDEKEIEKIHSSFIISAVLKA